MTMTRILSALTLAVCAAAALVVPAQAEEGGLTATLQAKVAEMSTAQQEALLTLLDGMGGAAAAKTEETKEAKAGDPKEAFLGAVKNIKKWAADEDLDALMAIFSEDFEHYEVGGKEDLRGFLKSAIDMGYISMYADDTEILTDDTEVEMDGEDKATFYPVDVEGPFGSATLEFEAKLEDGVWRITSLDISGV